MKYNLSDAVYKKTLGKFPLTAQDKGFIHKNMVNSKDVLPEVNSDLVAIYINGEGLLKNGKLTMKTGKKLDKQITTNHIMHDFLSRTNALNINFPIYKADLAKGYYQTKGLSDDTRGTFGKHLVKNLNKIRKHESRRLTKESGSRITYSYHEIINNLKPNQLKEIFSKTAFAPNATRPKNIPKGLENTIKNRYKITKPHVKNFAQAGKFLQNLGVKINKIKKHPTRKETERKGLHATSVNKHIVKEYHKLPHPKLHIKRGPNIN